MVVFVISCKSSTNPPSKEKILFLPFIRGDAARQRGYQG